MLQVQILKTIELNYKKSSNFKYAFPILENIFTNSEKNLAKFIGYSLIEISKYLGLLGVSECVTTAFFG